MDKNKKVYIYCRIGQENQKVLSIQENRIRAYAAEKGYEVLGVSSDIGSGLTLARPGWEHVLEVIKTQQVDILLMNDMARLSRVPSELFTCVSFMKQHGIELETLREGRIYNAEPMLKAMAALVMVEQEQDEEQNEL